MRKTKWSISAHVDLRSERVPEDDALRQMATAAEICRRLNDQPGVILADDVGMGKTFVALAVAASVVHESTSNQVVVMVPPAVGDKWPKDWSVFKEKCLHGGPQLRATERTITKGSEFLKLLDDAPARRRHIIFLSHHALSANLDDPFIKLAVIRAAFKYQRDLAEQRRALPRWAARILTRQDFSAPRVEALMATDPTHWQAVWNRVAEGDLGADPIPKTVAQAIANADLSSVRAAPAAMPLRDSKSLEQRLKEVRSALGTSLNAVWRESLRGMRAHLPLLILDEAHHLKNPNRLRGLFDAHDGSAARSVQGAFNQVFERMLLLTATPFQLGHRELISVLRLFQSTRIASSESARFEQQITELGQRLDAAQAVSLRLEAAWGRLAPADVAPLPANWWQLADHKAPESISTVVGFTTSAVTRMRDAEDALKPWVVRHSKVRQRDYLPGVNTLPSAVQGDGSGLPIAGPSVLPFLLAARAQAYVSMRGLHEQKKARALFADGLASSFEAYLSTRNSHNDALDDQEADPSPIESAGPLDWYLDRIAAALPGHDAAARAEHPKVAATVARALHHWRQGEKVLIFCFYRATGRALREHLSRAVGEEVARMARERFGLEGASVTEVFERMGERADSLLRRDRPGGLHLHAEARAIALQAGLTEDDQQHFGDVCVRFMRSPSFLARYVDLNQRSGELAVAQALVVPDGSAITLGAKLGAFARRIASLTPEERQSMWSALLTFSTGSRQVDTQEGTQDDEVSPHGVMLLPNVHLANGETKHEQRRRLMSTFNTPFLPEILVASSVMSEGVDLHRECRHVIHHDLDWNPSTLEQRTGRVDRLGSKASMSKTRIVVCEPFVAGTQDEKQYKVVKDRERWFSVVMGGRIPEDEWATDEIAQRIPLPEALMKELTLDLSVWPTQRID